MVIFLLIGLSFVFYNSFRFKNDSLLRRPDLKSLMFYRDFLLLTMLPYFYYWYDDKYKEHYVLSYLDSNKYFTIAALSAVVFIFIFLVTYRLSLSSLNKFTSRFQQDINYNRMLIVVSFLSVIVFFVVFFLSFKFNTGVIGLIKGVSYGEVAITRNYLAQSGGWLKFNKIFMKSWVPMLSYLFFYLHLTQNIKFGFLTKISFVLSLLSGVFASLFYLEKAVLFLYLFGFLGVYIYAGGRLKKHYIPLAFILSLLFVSLMYLLTYGDKIQDMEYLKNIIIHRTATQSVGSVMAFEYFSYHEFKGMAGVSNIWASILGEKFSSPYSDIIKYYVPETAETSGAMSSFATGEAYGLFGVVGVVLSGFIVALYFAFFEATKRSTLLSVLFVGLYGVYFSHPIVASSFYSFVWPVGLFYNIAPFFLILLISVSHKKWNN